MRRESLLTLQRVLYAASFGLIIIGFLYVVKIGSGMTDASGNITLGDQFLLLGYFSSFAFLVLVLAYAGWRVQMYRAHLQRQHGGIGRRTPWYSSERGQARWNRFSSKMDQVEAEAKRSPLGKLASYINEWVLDQPPPRSERARYERYVKRREEEKRRFSSHESMIGMGNWSGLPICALCGREIAEDENFIKIGHRQKRFVHVSCYEEEREEMER